MIHLFKMLSSVRTRKCSSQCNTEKICSRSSVGLFQMIPAIGWSSSHDKGVCFVHQELEEQAVFFPAFSMWLYALCSDYIPAFFRWLALDPAGFYIPLSSNIVKKQSPRFVNSYIAWSLVLFHLLCNLLLLLHYERSQPNPQTSSWVAMPHFFSKVPVSMVDHFFLTTTTVSISQSGFIDCSKIDIHHSSLRDMKTNIQNRKIFPVLLHL